MDAFIRHMSLMWQILIFIPAVFYMPFDKWAFNQSLLFYYILQGSQHSFWKLIRLGYFFTSYKHLLFATKCIFHIFFYLICINLSLVLMDSSWWNFRSWGSCGNVVDLSDDLMVLDGRGIPLTEKKCTKGTLSYPRTRNRPLSMLLTWI